MYPSRAFSPVLLLSIILLLAYSTPIILTHTLRQDTILADFQLLSLDVDYFDFSFAHNKFSTTCLSVEGIPSFSSIDLDAYLMNNNRNIVY